MVKDGALIDIFFYLITKPGDLVMQDAFSRQNIKKSNS